MEASVSAAPEAGTRSHRALVWFRRPTVRRAVLGIALVAGAGVLISTAGHSRDLGGYVLVGELAIADRHIYLDTPKRINTWPPFFSILCIPLALGARASVTLVRVGWTLANLAALVVALRTIGRLVHGRYPGFRPTHSGLFIGDLELLLPFLLTLRYLASNISHMQVNLLIFAITLAGLRRTVEGKERSGGALLGFGAAVKLMPLAFLPYLFWRGHFRAASLLAVSFTAFSLSPMLVYGYDRFVGYLTTWQAVLAQGWRTGKMNQSVYAAWDRILGHGELPFVATGTNLLQPSGDPMVSVAFGLSFVVALMAAVWAFGRSAKVRDEWCILAEWGAVATFATLFAPVTWKAYLVVLLLPNAILFAALLSDRVTSPVRRRLGWILLLAFGIGGAVSQAFVGKTIAWRLDMASGTTISALLLYAGCLYLRRTLAAPNEKKWGRLC